MDQPKPIINHFFIRNGQICSEPKRKVEAPVMYDDPVIYRIKQTARHSESSQDEEE